MVGGATAQKKNANIQRALHSHLISMDRAGIVASWVAGFWLKLLLGGLVTMFVGWMIQTDTFLNLVNWMLLITGIVSVLIFIGTKHPAALGTGAFTLAVRLMNLLDWAVDAVRMWFVAGGLTAAIVGTATSIVTHRGVFGRTAGATVLLAGICVSALKRSAASGELTRVTVGVVATVLTVLAVMVAAVAWVVAQRGW